MSISVHDLARKLADACDISVSATLPSPAPTAPATPAPAPAPSAGAPSAAAPVPAPAPISPIQETSHAAKGFHLDVRVAPDKVVSAAKVMNQEGFAIDAVTGVDWIANQEMEVVYDFFHFTSNCRVVIRTRIPRANPEVSTISNVFPGANWHERETHEFFGIRFMGHPNLEHLILPEDADYHPLRKDFAV